MSVSFVSINVRGLKNIVKRKAFFLFCKEQQANCFFLQETHSGIADEKFWKQQWGDEILFSHGTSYSAGVMVLFNKFPGKVIEHKSDTGGHWLIMVVEMQDQRYILLCVYGYNNRINNRVMMASLGSCINNWKITFMTEKVIIGGDFNIAPDSWLDRKPHRGQHPEYDDILTNLCMSTHTVDYWRISNPTSVKYTWTNSADSNQCSRLDYWLTSHTICKDILKCGISVSPLTDHCMIELSIKIIQQPKPSVNTWKFNNSLLLNDGFCKQVKILFQRVNKLDMSHMNKWEWFKFELKQLAIVTGKRISQIRKHKQKELILKINTICEKTETTTEEKAELNALQGKLDDMYRDKANGAFIRSRARWIELGEKNTSYFYGLEKHRQSKKRINKLKKNDIITDDQKQINDEIWLFYKNLYKSNFKKEDCDILFEIVKDNIKMLNEEDKKILEEDLTTSELESALKQMKNGKAPGIDGLTSEFYKYFWNDIKDLLHKAFLECIRKGCLSPTMKIGLITLLPKPNKDLLNLDNWRPITLLCNDYKLVALVYANRLKNVLVSLVDEFQSAFIKGRHIHNNVRLILDMLDYQSFIDSESLILFIDFFKAFDSVEHSFLIQTLKKFGFGEKFCKVIEMFYKDIISYVSLNPGMTPRINISRGIRQGCPISPKLFILCTQILAYLVVNNQEFKGINIFDYEFRISQFADDTVFFLKDKSVVCKALNIISLFSKASGLNINLKKCEILPLHPCVDTQIMSIPVKSEVKYLGIKLIKEIKKREEKNMNEKIENMKKTLNHWLMRDLSIFGRNLLSKSEGISKLIYPCYSIYVTPKNIKKANSIIYNFIWKNKTHYVKKSQLVKDYKKGGLKTLDFESMVGVFKINWIKAFMSQTESIWFHIPRGIFKKIGGLDFVLKCDFETTKLPVKLSEFHKQVLYYWKMIFSHNFTPQSSTLWNNRTITINRKTVFKQDWFDKKVFFVIDLMDNIGNFLDFNTFKEKFDVQCSYREFSKICKAIPRALVHLIQNTLSQSRIQAVMPELKIDQLHISDRKCINQFIGKAFKCKTFHDYTRNTKIRINNDLCNMDNCFKYLKWPIPPKAKEVQYKIINSYYPTAETLKKRFGFEVEACVFCLEEPETIEHLFYACRVTSQFWQNLHNWLSTTIENIRPFEMNHILIYKNDTAKEISNMINIIIIMGKYHIHACKWKNQRPSLIFFKNELNIFYSSLLLLAEKYSPIQKLCDGMSQLLMP